MHLHVVPCYCPQNNAQQRFLASNMDTMADENKRSWTRVLGIKPVLTMQRSQMSLMLRPDEIDRGGRA